MRGHLDRIATALADARAEGGLGHGSAWPAPVGGVADKMAALKRTKAAVRNAERPVTPVHAPPGEDDALHRAAAVLQRLVRGRAIQRDVLAAAARHAPLITELMTPVAAAAVPAAAAGDVAMTLVCAAMREVLQCVPSCCVAVRAREALRRQVSFHMSTRAGLTLRE